MKSEEPIVLEPHIAKIVPWIVAIAFFMQTLDGTILNTALPSMADSLEVSPFKMQSVIIAYMLTVALLIPASGWMADKLGTRRVFFSAIVLFSLGSALCALSPTLNFLVFSRIVQGIGGAMMLPVGRLVILRAYPRTELVRILSFVTMPGLIGPLIGPTLGGWLVQYASWHWIFLINLPVGVIGCIVTQRYLPDIKMPYTAGFDWSGFALFGLSMVFISMALQGMGSLHLRQAYVVLLFVIGMAALCAYWLHAVRVKRPLFSTKLFQTRTFSVGILGNIFGRLGSGGMPFLTPLLLQIGLGYSPSKAGMTMIPLALAAMSAKVISQPLISRLGYRRLLSVNTVVLGLLTACFGLISTNTPYWAILLLFTAFGSANSLQFTAMNTVTLIDLPNEQASSGNSLLSVVMQLSMSLGVAASAALLGGFTAYYGTHTLLQTLGAFHATYVSIGALCVLAGAIFLQLPRRDEEMLHQANKH